MARLESVEIPAPHGRLEALLRLPDSDATPQMAAVVCHPHPLYGGTMHNKVVFRIAQALGAAGLPVLRFNFRGVGRSTGSYDDRRGESDDVRVALDWLAARFPHVPLCLAGFSFGSAVGLPVGCADERVRQIIGAGVPVRSLRIDTLAGCEKHKLIVQGEQDEYGPRDALLQWFEQLPDPKTVEIIPGSDHFFTEYQTELYAAVERYMRSGMSALGVVAGR